MVPESPLPPEEPAITTVGGRWRRHRNDMDAAATATAARMCVCVWALRRPVVDSFGGYDEIAEVTGHGSNAADGNSREPPGADLGGTAPLLGCCDASSCVDLCGNRATQATDA